MATANYSTDANFGREIALAASEVRSAKARLDRAVQSAGALAGQPFDATKLVGGDFGAASGNGQALYDGANGLLLALDTPEANYALNTIDKGL